MLNVVEQDLRVPKVGQDQRVTLVPPVRPALLVKPLPSSYSQARFPIRSFSPHQSPILSLKQTFHPIAHH